jgi:transmembrane sensor
LADPDSPIAGQARRWAVALAAGPLPSREQKRFEQWLAADPAHAAAFATSRALFEDLGRLEALRAYARLPARPPSPFARLRLWWEGAPAAPRLALGAATLALVVALAWPFVSIRTDVYQTGVGQTRQVALADGSQVALGPASSLRVRLSPGRRDAYLDEGEAFFTVAKQHGRPFLVDAGQAHVRVVGTRFNVRRDASQVRVAVQEGVVQVGAHEGQTALTLGRGQDATARNGALTEGRIDVAEAGAWRDGRVYYAGARLSEVVADARRYTARPIAFASPEIAQLEVTASFRTEGFEAFITGLPSVLPVVVTTQPDGSLLIRTAKAS